MHASVDPPPQVGDPGGAATPSWGPDPEKISQAIACSFNTIAGGEPFGKCLRFSIVRERGRMCVAPKEIRD